MLATVDREILNAGSNPVLTTNNKTMTNRELLQLERLLTKYHIETKSATALEKIRPCLFMVREKLALNKIEQNEHNGKR